MTLRHRMYLDKAKLAKDLNNLCHAHCDYKPFGPRFGRVELPLIINFAYELIEGLELQFEIVSLELTRQAYFD